MDIFTRIKTLFNYYLGIIKVYFINLYLKIIEYKIFGIIWWWYLYPVKWGAFLRGTFMKEEVPFEYCEIVLYRSLMCEQCIKEGKCIDCGCNIPDKMMDLESGCSMSLWDQTTVEEWKEYKKRTGLKFEIVYGS